MSESFPPWIQERGDALRQQGVVEIIGRSSVDVELSVRDDLPWNVTLRLRRDGGGYAACNCPAGRRGSGHCRHVWAGLRTAEEAGLLAPAGSAPSAPSASPSVPEPVAPRRVESPKAAPRRAPARSAPVPSHGWRERLHDLRAATTRSARAPAAEGLGELWYIVDAGATARSGRFTLDLAERRPATAGRASPLRPVRASMARLETVADQKIECAGWINLFRRRLRWRGP